MRGGGASDTYHIPAPSKSFPSAIVFPVIAAVVLFFVLAAILGAYIVHRRHKIELRKLFDEFQATSTQTADIEGALQKTQNWSCKFSIRFSSS
jgi:hypothetical protein